MTRLILCLLFIHAQAVSAEAPGSETILSQELNSVIAERAAFNFREAKDFSDLFSRIKFQPSLEDIKFLKRVSQGVKSWPHVSVSASTILVGDGKYKIAIEVKDFEKHILAVNGRIMNYDSKKDLRSQLKALFAPQKVSRLENFFDALIPNAYAIGPTGIIGMSEIAQGDMATGNALLAADLAMEASGGAVAISAGGLATMAAIVLAVGAVGFVGYCYLDATNLEGNTSGNRFKNCLTAPLSMVGLNWRDNLYVESINCPSVDSKILSINYKSATGIVEQDWFYPNDADGSLEYFKSSVIPPGGRSNETEVSFNPNHKIKSAIVTDFSPTMPTSHTLEGEKRLRPYLRVAENYSYLINLCHDSKRVEALNKALAAGRKVAPNEINNLEKSETAH